MADVRLTATNPQDSSVVPVACNSKGELLLEQPPEAPEFDGNLDGDLSVSGSATFANGNTEVNSDGLLRIKRSIANGALGLGIFPDNDFSQPATAVINTDGSAAFAGGEAGFTAEGYLWCTTRRGDRVILDATSNGLGSWVDYEERQTQDL